jgi:hypothetical protein
MRDQKQGKWSCYGFCRTLVISELSSRVIHRVRSISAHHVLGSAGFRSMRYEVRLLTHAFAVRANLHVAFRTLTLK